MPGKYFFIVSKLNDLVLDIEGNDPEPGAKVVLWTRKEDEEPDNQLWYEDFHTGTIRSKLNDLCLTGSEEGLYMEEYGEGNDEQQWTWRPLQNMFRARGDRNMVFDVLDGNTDEGARVGIWEENGGDNQQFDIERVSLRYFIIRSKMDEDLVLDIEDANPDEGANVITWKESGDDNQLWYEDEENCIRSKLNDMAFTCDGDEEEVTMQPADHGRTEQHWRRKGECIQRRFRNQVLDIKGGRKRKGGKIIAFEYNGGDNQKWSFEYRV